MCGGVTHALQGNFLPEKLRPAYQAKVSLGSPVIGMLPQKLRPAILLPKTLDNTQEGYGQPQPYRL